MSTTQIVTITTITTALIIGITLFAGRILAHDYGGGHFMKGNYSESGHDRHHRPMGRLCGDNFNERIDKISGKVAKELELNVSQQEAWGLVTASIEQAKQNVQGRCEQFKAQGRPDTAPEKMAALEMMLSDGLSVVQQIRPAVDNFYQILDEQQQEYFDKLMSKHRRHH